MAKKYQTSYFVFLITAGVYLLTVSPTINWRDTPEFANLSYTLGIAHPAGFPTYSLFAKLLSLFPIGSIAFRANLFSLISAAASVCFLFLTCYEILLFFNKEKEESRSLIVAIAVAMLFFVNKYCWGNAVTSEVYTLNAFFTVMIIFLAVTFIRTKDIRYFFVTAFLYGLSSGNHATVVFYLPGVLIFYLLENKEKKMSRFLWISLFFLMGFSVYAFLPLRSLTNPSFDWGNPETIANFIAHITDRKTAYSHFAGFNSFSIFLENMISYMKALNSNITVLGILFAVIGVKKLYQMRKSLFYLINTILLSNTIFFIDWNGGVQLPSYICYMILISIGIFYSLEWFGVNDYLPGRKKAEYVLLSIFSVIILINGARNFQDVSKTNIYTGEDEFKEAYLSLPENSMILVGYLYFHYRYYQDILGLRRDLALVGYGEIFSPKHFSASKLSGEFNIKYLASEKRLSKPSKILEFLSLNLGNGYRIFTEAVSKYRGLSRRLRYFDGVLFEFSESEVVSLSNSEVIKLDNYFNKKIFRFINDIEFRHDRESDFVYIQLFTDCIDYFLDYGYLDNVSYMLDSMTKVFGPDLRNSLKDNDISNMHLLLGVMSIKKGDLERAEKIFNKMIDNKEAIDEAYNKLGIISQFRENYLVAEKYFVLSIKNNPGLLDNYIRLVDIYGLLGQAGKISEINRLGHNNLLLADRKELMLKVENKR